MVEHFERLNSVPITEHYDYRDKFRAERSSGELYNRTVLTVRHQEMVVNPNPNVVFELVVYRFMENPLVPPAFIQWAVHPWWE